METEAAKGIAEEAVNGGRRDGAGRGAAASVAAQLIDLRGRVEAAAWGGWRSGRSRRGRKKSGERETDLFSTSTRSVFSLVPVFRYVI